jgi:hypothetical protein
MKKKTIDRISGSSIYLRDYLYWVPLQKRGGDCGLAEIYFLRVSLRKIGKREEEICNMASLTSKIFERRVTPWRR